MALQTQGEIGKATNDIHNFIKGSLSQTQLSYAAGGYPNTAALAIANYLNSGAKDPDVITNMIVGVFPPNKINASRIEQVREKIANPLIKRFETVFTPPQEETPKTETETQQPTESIEDEARRLMQERIQLTDQLSQLQSGRAGQDWAEQYGQLRGQKIKEQTALGRITEPTGQETINKSDIEAQKSLRNVIGQIQQGSLAAKTGFLGEVAPTVLSARTAQEQSAFQKQSLNEQIRQFNENVRLQQEKMNQDLMLGQLSQETARQLGRERADSMGTGWLDYLNTAIGGLGALGTFSGSPAGKATGAGLLGLLNMFKSTKKTK